ncbi:MAG: YczE/YyaS/YitT family protein [Eubacterium sp.]
MRKKELIKRYIIFLIGLFIVSLGISFITKANLGTSPISSIPYVLSLGFDLTLGQFTILFSILLIIFQIILLGKKFKISSLLQIPASFLFGYFIDLTMMFLWWLNPSNYVAKIGSLLIGCCILALGVYFEVLANVVMLPGESFINAISIRFNTNFGNTKVCCDTSMAVIAILISIVLFHSIEGVREGTVISAAIGGFIVKFYGKIFGKLEKKVLMTETN